ncbi:reverse transcriptase domain-containing protein [Tanacetum coccineum]
MKLNLKSFLGHLITKHGIKANPLKVKAVANLDQPRTLKDIQSLNGKLATLSRFLSKGVERSLAFFKVLKGCKDKKSIEWTTKADKALEKIKKLIQTLPTLTTLRAGETLSMHLAALNESISVVLAAKRNEGWTPIYFVSRDLQGAELNYPALEKLVLALQILTGPEKTRIVAKWAIELGEHDILFLRREEKETPADFLVEIPPEDNEKKEKPKEAIKGTFAAKQASIKDYFQKVKTALRGFEDYTVEHVRMNQNRKTDALRKLASMTFEHLTKEVLVKVLTKRSIEEKEVLEVETQERKSWMDPIHEYLLSGLLPEDKREAKKIKIQVPQYKLIQGNLEVAKAIQDCEKCKEESAIRKAGTSKSITAGSTWPFSH